MWIDRGGGRGLFSLFASVVIMRGATSRDSIIYGKWEGVQEKKNVGGEVGERGLVMRRERRRRKKGGGGRKRPQLVYKGRRRLGLTMT